MIPTDAGETLNQLQPTRVLLSPASAPYSSCRQLPRRLTRFLARPHHDSVCNRTGRNAMPDLMEEPL